jgi:hypothetical protein
VEARVGAIPRTDRAERLTAHRSRGAPDWGQVLNRNIFHDLTPVRRDDPADRGRMHSQIAREFARAHRSPRPALPGVACDRPRKSASGVRRRSTARSAGKWSMFGAPSSAGRELQGGTRDREKRERTAPGQAGGVGDR